VAPEARNDDGLFDVVAVAALGRARLVRRLPRIYRGAHLRDPAVSLHRGRVLEAEPRGAPVPVELDGEPLGFLPARFAALPGALPLVGPAACPETSSTRSARAAPRSRTARAPCASTTRGCARSPRSSPRRPRPPRTSTRRTRTSAPTRRRSPTCWRSTRS